MSTELPRAFRLQSPPEWLHHPWVGQSWAPGYGLTLYVGMMAQLRRNRGGSGDAIDVESIYDGGIDDATDVESIYGGGIDDANDVESIYDGGIDGAIDVE